MDAEEEIVEWLGLLLVTVRKGDLWIWGMRNEFPIITGHFLSQSCLTSALD